MGGQYIEPVSLASLLGSLPGQCSICRDWGRGALCAACRERYAATRPRCERCAIAVPAGQTVCGECLRESPPFERTIAALDYDLPWSALIARFKFHGGIELAPLFASLLRDAAGGQPAPDLLLPAPLSDARLRERGFNQSWEIARRLGRNADARLLLRIRDTPHQIDLPLERRASNVREAFAVEPLRRAELAGRSVVVVDDVMTTGATAAEMARTLLQAGASRVQLWVLARTPRPDGA
jgi:ComF family protein